ncbi:uncharacterized protein MONBRDRAFT_7382 [Monosiga brevicollis MX1]|uniref:SIPAR domain-containing protein n=1 Tax=Monosiga brevicollis TaxID=81824 RepID=A9UWS9_MONBE|nr:uncharacterized protein MONBRDRAFT_7382 [Monosiga brevicollis MX1]EDQ90095.1 predicted protein [Monosiga brevicollis MX1]|eukprot:XP_001744862.1 hypothetical protein [Monosiga brevicollis MX1]
MHALRPCLLGVRQPGVGQGWRWWPYGKTISRPVLIHVDDAINLNVHGLTLVDSPGWNTRFRGEHLNITHLRIESGLDSCGGYTSAPNTDGINIGGQHIYVADIFVHNGDDCIPTNAYDPRYAGLYINVFEEDAVSCEPRPGTPPAHWLSASQMFYRNITGYDLPTAGCFNCAASRPCEGLHFTDVNLHRTMSDGLPPLSAIAAGARTGVVKQPLEIKGKRRALKPIPAALTQARPTTAAASSHDLSRFLGQVTPDKIEDLLQRTGTKLHAIRQALQEAETTVVLLSHFWLSEISDENRDELLEMEQELFLEELRLLAPAGISDQEARIVLRVCFPEMPGTFYEEDGAGFLDMLHVTLAQGSPAFRQFLTSITYDRCIEQGFARPGTSSGSRSYSHRPLTRTQQRGATAAGGGHPEQLNDSLADSTSEVRLASQLAPLPAISSGRNSSEPNEAESVKEQASNAAVREAFLAAELGHADVLFYYLERNLVDMAATDELGRSLLFVAAVKGHMDVATMLLANDAQPLINRLVGSSHRGPLHSPSAFYLSVRS